jgi:acetyltransferase
VTGQSLGAVFRPRRVAVVGASDRPGKTGTLVMRNLAAFEGEVVPVTRSQDEVGGRKAYPDLRAVPGLVDLAVLTVPAGAVPTVLEDAAAAGVGAAVVMSSGFAEIGEEGARLQEAAVAAARKGRVRLVGPNCFGVQNCATGLNASIALGTPATGGAISLATQSGAYGVAIYTLGVEEDLGFAKIYSAGNKAEVSDAEVLAYLGDDDETRVVCLFLESMAGGREFFDQLRRVAARKPVIVAKTGRTEAGARAAVSHTAALATEAAVWQAALEQGGAVQARTGLEMIDAAKALEWQPAPAGPRVGIVTNSGGTGVELTDLLGECGLEVPELSPALQRRLAARLPGHASPRNPVDVTPVWAEYEALYPWCAQELGSSGEVDAVILVLLHRSAMDPDVVAAVRDVAASLPVPLYVCWIAPEDARENRVLLQRARIPCFDWPERTARAVANAARFGRVRGQAPPEPAPAGVPELPALPDEGMLAPETAAALVAAFGVEVPAQRVCTDADDAVAAAAAFEEVVAKLVSDRLVHKSDAGGVRLGLRGEQAVRDVFEELRRLDPDGAVLVQPQLGGVEVIVGGARDPAFGPLVLVGLGGVLVEVLGSTVVRLAPIDEREAAAALRSLRGFDVLTGVRGRPAADLDALVRTVSGVSQLMAAVPGVAELDLNPVLASPDGAVAVDVRVRMSRDRAFTHGG